MARGVRLGVASAAVGWRGSSRLDVSSECVLAPRSLISGY